ncbi:hypothetical protein Q75_10560 [Bacillus coahuilensis p1.1.43]|uniref:Uncharacterized protein n=1 Tax=Bacillus coahuilensis p1.1.43 TaxID=1150625 RepID=A0A147K6Z8_9BACI|nr:hypothetical protein Q75_10560 [Bacillus coahuilensis p1.1.43]
MSISRASRGDGWFWFFWGVRRGARDEGLPAPKEQAAVGKKGRCTQSRKKCTQEAKKCTQSRRIRTQPVDCRTQERQVHAKSEKVHASSQKVHAKPKNPHATSGRRTQPVDRPRKLQFLANSICLAQQN